MLFNKLQLFVVLLQAVWLVGCSTYHLKIQTTLQHVSQREYLKAAEAVKPMAFTPGGDQLAYLLEYATIQQLAGNYEESNKAFQLADRMSEVKDYVSLSDQAASMVFSQSMVAYQGDDYEKMLINVFSAMNYAAQGNFESGLVEVRRLNEKLNNYRSESGRDYLDNPFAYYLSAVLWEKQKQFDSACIDYQKFYEITEKKDHVKQDLLYCSYKAQRFSQLDKFKKDFNIKSYGRSDVKDREKKADIFVVVHHGWGPRKIPNPAWHRVPVLQPTPSYIDKMEAVVTGLDGKETIQEDSSWEAVSVEKLGIDALQKQYAGLMAKRIAARIVKKQMAREIEKEHQGLGLIAAVAMDIADQADLRQWSTLPKSIHIMRFQLPPGKYNLSLKGRMFSGETALDEEIPLDIEKPELKLLIRKFAG